MSADVERELAFCHIILTSELVTAWPVIMNLIRLTHRWRSGSPDSGLAEDFRRIGHQQNATVVTRAIAIKMDILRKCKQLTLKYCVAEVALIRHLVVNLYRRRLPEAVMMLY